MNPAEATYPSVMTTRWLLSPLVAWAGIAAVAAWFLWGMMPPSIVPAAPFWVEVGVPPIIGGVLFALIAAGLSRRTVPRTVGGTALGLLGGVIALHAIFIWVALTFPADF